MKKVTLYTAVVLALTAGSVTLANASTTTCASKKAELQRQIQIAERFGNYHEVLGLKHALAEVNMHCSDAQVSAKIQQKIAKIERKIAEKKADIVEIQYDLREAQARGKISKIAKYKRKIAEKQADIAELQAELASYRAQLG